MPLRACPSKPALQVPVREGGLPRTRAFGAGSFLRWLATGSLGACPSKPALQVAVREGGLPRTRAFGAGSFLPALCAILAGCRAGGPTPPPPDPWSERRAALVAALQQCGRRVSVVSTLQTQPPMVADELRRQADQFIDLADLEDQICRDPASRPVREPREGGPRALVRRQQAAPAPATLSYPDDEDDDRP